MTTLRRQYWKDHWSVLHWDGFMTVRFLRPISLHTHYSWSLQRLDSAKHWDCDYKHKVYIRCCLLSVRQYIYYLDLTVRNKFLYSTEEWKHVSSFYASSSNSQHTERNGTDFSSLYYVYMLWKKYIPMIHKWKWKIQKLLQHIIPLFRPEVSSTVTQICPRHQAYQNYWC